MSYEWATPRVVLNLGHDYVAFMFGTQALIVKFAFDPSELLSLYPQRVVMTGITLQNGDVLTVDYASRTIKTPFIKVCVGETTTYRRFYDSMDVFYDYAADDRRYARFDFRTMLEATLVAEICEACGAREIQ